VSCLSFECETSKIEDKNVTVSANLLEPKSKTSVQHLQHFLKTNGQQFHTLVSTSFPDEGCKNVSNTEVTGNKPHQVVANLLPVYSPLSLPFQWEISFILL
jgi:hypothetical protein